MEPRPTSDLQYAVPSPSYGHKVLAGAAILLAGLGLVVLGGCFLIGVMLITSHGFNNSAAAQPLSSASLILIAILYVLAFASFGGAVAVFLVAMRALLSVMRS